MAVSQILVVISFFTASNPLAAFDVKPPYDFRGISNRDTEIGNIFCYNVICADYAMLADGHIPHDYRIDSNPTLVPNRYLIRISGDALVHDRNSKLLIFMMGIGNKDVGCNQDKLADADFVGCRQCASSADIRPFIDHDHWTGCGIIESDVQPAVLLDDNVFSKPHPLNTADVASRIYCNLTRRN
jgi:hypothetical protein